jgi:hypothetical protein
VVSFIFSFAYNIKKLQWLRKVKLENAVIKNNVSGRIFFGFVSITGYQLRENTEN